MGLCCANGAGYYSVSIDGEEVVYGGYFTDQRISHKIIAGYNPSLSTRDIEWLDAHNTLREKFHLDNKVEYRPLTWSPKLAASAAKWRDELLKTCQISGESGVMEGENISAKTVTGQGENSQGDNPQTVMQRWVDSKVDDGYPDNQSLTQVMWRGTRYLGCADGSAQLGSKVCYVSVCRYARAGNCSVKSYGSWLAATLEDHTKCGPICPGEGCH